MRIVGLVFCVHILAQSEAANILVISLFPSPSHSHVMAGIANALAEAGHNVTLVSSSPRFKTDNIRVVELKWPTLNSPRVSNAIQRFKLSPIETVVDMYHLGTLVCEYGLASPGFKELTYKSAEQTFDLVIFSNFVSECALAAIHHWNVPIIAVGTSGPNIYVNEMVGALTPYATVPHLFSGIGREMSFWQRFDNVKISLFDTFYRKWFYLRTCNAIIRKYIPDSPNLENLIVNSVDFVFLNSHVATRVPQSLPANMIEIGGIHLQSGKGNSKEVQEFMDSSPNGVIFFSIGTNTNLADMPPAKLNALINVFGKHRVIWKSDRLKISNPNVLVGEWFSQKDILAHPKCRLFITHGGLLSVTEALNYGIPMLGIPLFNDQLMNIDFASNNGFAIHLNLDNITEKSLNWAIDEVFKPSYRENALKFSKILQDNYQNQSSKIVYWSEYLIRYKGAKHLRQNGINMPLYKFLLLDIIFTIFIFMSIIMILTIFIYRKCKIVGKVNKIKKS